MPQRSAQRCADSKKKVAKINSAALRVYNIYSPSAAEAIFAAASRGKIEHLRHLCRSLQRSAKMAAKMPTIDQLLEFYGVRGFTSFRILWGAGFWDKMNTYQKCGGCCVYFGARGS